MTLAAARQATYYDNRMDRVETPTPPPVPASAEQASAGTLHFLADFPSEHLGECRTISVWLPHKYDESSTQRFPVFYLHDGQNLFDPATSYTGVAWDAGLAAEKLIHAGAIQPVILVGIANSQQRLNEYGPTRDKRLRNRDRSREYARFLIEELKPFIDRGYRTQAGREHTGVGGSSMGALISLHLCQWHADVFSKCAALSPSLWWDDERFLRRLPLRPGWMQQVRIWLCMGDREGPPRAWSANLRRTRRLAALLREHGRLEGRDFKYVEVADGEHHESAWAARFGDVLRFLFGK